MSDTLYPNNKITIKRVVNGYVVETEETTELNPELIDGAFIFPSLTELIAFIAERYKDE